MGPTPLYDALRAFANENPLRFHMPGHKGRALALSELSAVSPLDFTELSPTGDLFEGDGPIREAEALWADAVHMKECLFLTGGSTQGMLSALTLAAEKTSLPLHGGTPFRGAKILMDRGSHRSVYNGLALLDLEPVYLERPWLEHVGVFGPTSPQDVDNFLKNDSYIKTVCITSPTYYGVLSNIPAIAEIVHTYGGMLVVDAAHGAHLPFLGDYGLSAADLVVTSAHKTLPALGQSALLFAGGQSAEGGAAHDELRRAASLFGSSSPSYVLMASLDGARAWMEDEGRSAYEAVVKAVAHLRVRFPSLSDGDAPLDPARFVLRTADGFGVRKALEEHGIYPEMADSGHVVFIFSCADGAGDVERLEQALEKINPPAACGDSPFCGGGEQGKGTLPPPVELVLSPRAARFSPAETVRLSAAAGRVSACQIAPYPPGVPVVAPGERIGKKHLAYLDEIGYNMEQDVQVVAL